MNDQMPTLVRMRLALSYIHDHELEVVEKESLMKAAREYTLSRSRCCLTIISTSDVAIKDKTMYLDLVAELEDQGFIQRTFCTDTFAVTKEQEKVKDARSRYLDPLARISDYVGTLPDDSGQRVPSIGCRITNA